MADKKLYDTEGNPISNTVSKEPPRSYYDVNGSPLQLNPSGVKQGIGNELYTPHVNKEGENAAPPYVGRLAANSFPAAGSFLAGPAGTLAGTGISELIKHMAPGLFGQPAEDPGFESIQNLVLNDAIPGIAGPVLKTVSSPIQTISKALMGTGNTGRLLRKFPAAREGMITALTKQLTGGFSPPAETQILDGAADSANQHFGDLTESIRKLMEGNPVTKNIPDPNLQTMYEQPWEISLPTKPTTYAKAGSHGKELSPQSKVAIDKWKQDIIDTNEKNVNIQKIWKDSVAKTTKENAEAIKATTAARSAESARIRGGDIFSDPTESMIQSLNNMYGDKTIGDSLLKLKNQTGDLTKTQSYKDITRKVLGDVTGVQNFKVIAGPEATEQLALNRLLSGSESGISGSKILGELGGKNVEIYREALRPQTYDNFKNLLGEIATQQQSGTADKLLNWAGGKLKFMTPLALAHGTIPSGAGILGGVALTNSAIAKAMSNPETANLVVEAMRTPANSAKGNLLSHVLSGLITGNHSIPANLIRGVADIATVPDN